MATSKARCGDVKTVVFEFEIEDDAGKRLDVFLAEQDDPPISRSQIKKAIDGGDVRVNATRVKAGYTLREGDLVAWEYAPPVAPNLEPEDIDLEILYEDADLAVVNKPHGMVVHPAPGHPSGTLVNALLYHFKDLPGVGGVLRPGIVHRIDKDTSGALAISKSDAGHQHLSALFKAHTIAREYHALVFGPGLEERGTIKTLYGRKPNDRIRYSSKVETGKVAITHFKVAERFDNGVCLVVCRLETGRTHQIRVHLSDINAPLLGDHVYGGKAASQCKLISRQALHAKTLGFPTLDGADILTEASYPADFSEALEALRAGKDWR